MIGKSISRQQQDKTFIDYELCIGQESLYIIHNLSNKIYLGLPQELMEPLDNIIKQIFGEDNSIANGRDAVTFFV